jgi:hypothetical protein
VCAGKDAGVHCCVQVCCCGPCVYGSALQTAGFEDATLYAVLLCCGGRTAVDEVAGYSARRRLVARYGIREDPLTGLLLSCVCAPCARYQEVNTILVRERRTYGCARVVPDATTPPSSRMAPVRAVPACLVRADGGTRV